MLLFFQEIATARKHGTKNKRLALHALKRKKQFEKQLEHIDGVLNTLEYQKVALENASTNTEVLNVMKGATDALKSAHHNMDVDQVCNLVFILIRSLVFYLCLFLRLSFLAN